MVPEPLAEPAGLIQFLRDRDVGAIAQYHGALAAAGEQRLDEWTAKDHRLRISPTPEDRTAFESLMTRLGRDATERERLQASLSSLRDPAGDVWRLTQPGVLDTRRSDALLPFLGLIAPASLLLTVIWPPALVTAILALFVNMAVRYRTAPRLRAPLHYFRQVAPLLAAARAVSHLLAEDRPLSENRCLPTFPACTGCGSSPAG